MVVVARCIVGGVVSSLGTILGLDLVAVVVLACLKLGELGFLWSRSSPSF